MFTLELYDSYGNKLKSGDIVRISDGQKYNFFAEVKYLEVEQVIAPFHTFSFHHFEKVDNVPDHAKNIYDNKSGKKIARFLDVVNYIKNKNQSGNMFEETGEDQNHSCMSFYGICE